MPLYLSDDDVDADRYSAESLREAREELDAVTPDDAERTAPGSTRQPGIPADRDADFTRDAELSRREALGVLVSASAAQGVAEAQTRIVPARQPDGPGPGPEIMAADTLQGDRVLNLQGELLGKIRDIMLDVRHGRIAYAVLSSGGAMGLGDRLYAVPWSALTLDAEQRCFVLEISRERLMSAPAFDREQWPSMADPAFVTSVHDYYGRPSYWKSPV